MYTFCVHLCTNRAPLRKKYFKNSLFWQTDGQENSKKSVYACTKTCTAVYVCTHGKKGHALFEEKRKNCGTEETKEGRLADKIEKLHDMVVWVS